MSSHKKPSNYTSIPVTCSTSREPLKTSKIDRIQQSPWRPATIAVTLIIVTFIAVTPIAVTLIAITLIAITIIAVTLIAIIILIAIN